MDEEVFYTYVGKMFRADPKDLTPATRLREDLGMTSQAAFGLSALIEKLSGKQANFADINTCKTLGDIMALAE